MTAVAGSGDLQGRGERDGDRQIRRDGLVKRTPTVDR